MKKGMLAGIFACVFAVLGILFLGIVFVPLAFIVAIIGTVLAVKAKEIASIGVNILAWILVLIGFATSPLLVAAIGIGASAHSSSSVTRDEAREAMLSTDAQSLIQDTCAYYQAQGKFDTVELMTMISSVDNKVNLSNGGVVNLKAGEDNCVAYTYATDGTITIEAAKDAKGKACTQFLKSDRFKKIAGLTKCKK
jgi:hypothetical protein